jgi:ElaB/YqjD/DUF883 family membrane-anchored ribosome-binding protein
MSYTEDSRSDYRPQSVVVSCPSCKKQFVLTNAEQDRIKKKGTLRSTCNACLYKFVLTYVKGGYSAQAPTVAVAGDGGLSDSGRESEDFDSVVSSVLGEDSRRQTATNPGSRKLSLTPTSQAETNDGRTLGDVSGLEPGVQTVLARMREDATASLTRACGELSHLYEALAAVTDQRQRQVKQQYDQVMADLNSIRTQLGTILTQSGDLLRTVDGAKRSFQQGNTAALEAGAAAHFARDANLRSLAQVVATLVCGEIMAPASLKHALDAYEAWLSNHAAPERCVQIAEHIPEVIDTVETELFELTRKPPEGVSEAERQAAIHVLQKTRDRMHDWCRRVRVERFGEPGEAFSVGRHQRIDVVEIDDPCRYETIEAIRRSGYLRVGSSDEVLRKAQVVVWVKRAGQSPQLVDPNNSPASPPQAE